MLFVSARFGGEGMLYWQSVQARLTCRCLGKDWLGMQFLAVVATLSSRHVTHRLRKVVAVIPVYLWASIFRVDIIAHTGLSIL